LSKAETSLQLDPCITVGVDFGKVGFADSLDELALLAGTAGFECRAVLTGKRKAPDSAHFIGSGKLQELQALCAEHEPTVVIFDQLLSPVQQRNLERALERTVIDRTGLILDIFAQRAKSHEGKLQVELAQVQYQATRLVRQWSHLERQRGGIGVRGGPGERQIELDRRMLSDKVKGIKARLGKVQKQRDTQRRARLRSGVLRVSIVGYTNAGKSTLFNALTTSRTFAADQLFATLDTTTRRLKPGGNAELVLSDTVGFVRDLPHMLVAAFKATLQEAVDADILLHVVDSASELRDEQIESVNAVLEDIEAGDITQWIVMNKIDLTQMAPSVGAQVVTVGAVGAFVPVFHVSARSGVGVDALRTALADAAAKHFYAQHPHQAMTQDRAYAHDAVAPDA
jgi:GTPase